MIAIMNGLFELNMQIFVSLKPDMIRIQEVVFQVYGNQLFFSNKIVAFGSIIYDTCNQR